MKAAVVVASVAALAVGVGAWLYVSNRPAAPRTGAPGPRDDLERQLKEIWPLVEAANRASAAERPRAIEAARARIRLALVNMGNEPDLHFWLGVVEVMDHKEAAAQAEYLAVVGAAPGGPRNRNAMYLRAIHVLEFDPAHAEEAVALLRDLRAAAPRFMTEPVDRALVRALLRVHYAQIDRKEHDKAVDLMEEAIRVAGTHPDLQWTTRRAHAYACALAGRWNECEREWKSLLVDDPAAATMIRFQLAGAYAAQNKAADAEAEYTAVLAALDAGKENAETTVALKEALLRRGNCRRMLGRFPEAQADIEAYLKVNPADYRAEYWLAVVLIDGFEKPADAEPHLVKAHAAAPYCDTYLHLLVKLYEDLLPDPAKAAPLRAEYEEQKKERAARRAELVKEGVFDGLVCD